jgi:hypothetical protein
MHPHRRAVGNLHKERAAGDHEADEEDDENGGPVGGIGEAEIEAAGAAARRELQETVEEAALAAARTAALQPRGDRLLRRIEGPILAQW